MKFNSKKYSLLKDIDRLNERNHSILLYDNEEYCKLLKYRYLRNGLENGEHCFLFISENIDKIEKEITTYGIDINYFKKRKILHIYQITDEIKNLTSSKLANTMEKLVMGLKPPFRMIGRIIPDISTKEGMERELNIEQEFHSTFDNYDCSFLCTYNVDDIEKDRLSLWIKELVKNHHNMIYATEPEKSVCFDTDLLTITE